MSPRFEYEVGYGKDKWLVEKDGKTVVMENGEYALFNRKQDAVDYARNQAKKSGFSILKIHKKNGELMTSHKYGSDPTPEHRK